MDSVADYEAWDALEMATRVREAELSPADLLEAAIARAERRADLNAIPIPMFDAAREVAAGAVPEGPFSGVPFLLKDLYAAHEGWRLTNGSQLYADQVSDHDHALVARYKQAGLVLFGRTASPEFGITTTSESVLFGATRNPWNPEHTAGGSSGGAAAAVAAGIVPAAHASDGGGSIRVPASCCGLFGMKPTRARTPAGPLVGEGWAGMSTAHAVTRSVRDSAALLDASEGPELGDPYWAPPPARPYLEEVGRDPGRLRIAVQTQAFNGKETHPDCVRAAEVGAEVCENLGHEVVLARLEVDASAVGRATQAIIASNVRLALEDGGVRRGREPEQADVEPLTWAMAALAKQTLSGPDYARAVRTIHGVGRAVASFLQDFDVLLTPTMAIPPCRIGELALTNADVGAMMERLMATVGYTQLMNAAGNPAMSVPLYWNAEGLPIGTQFVGRFGDEGSLFRLAAQLEAVRPWWDRRPNA